MSRTIEIRGLSDAQCDALAEEAKAAGLKFYDHCRAKLLANTAVAVVAARTHAGPILDHTAFREAYQGRAPRKAEPQAPAPGDDRIGRLEAMMARMGETLEMLATNPPHLVEQQVLTSEIDIDVDDVIGQSLAAAEQAGLTVVEREQPAHDGGVRHLGSRRAAPFSVSTVPQHLRNLV